jgi:hypothetical protein
MMGPLPPSSQPMSSVERALVAMASIAGIGLSIYGLYRVLAPPAPPAAAPAPRRAVQYYTVLPEAPPPR